MEIEESDTDARSAAYNAWVTDPIRTEYHKLREAEQYFMIPPEIYNTAAFIRSRRYSLRYIEQHSEGCQDALIPYMAMTFCDRLGGKCESLEDDHENIHLLVDDLRRNKPLFLLSCLTLAWKMQTKLFNLTGFLQNKNLDYSTGDVLEMEFLVCRRLKWRLRTLTPFCFIEYMLPILGTEHGKPSPRRLVRLLITRSQSDVAFLEYRPSILAAAALVTVSKNMCSETHHHDFEFRVRNSEVVSTQEDLFNKCVEHLGEVFMIQMPNSIPTDTTDDTPPPRQGQRPGKQILRSGGSSSSSQVDQDSEWLMNFELGWIRAQDDNDGSCTSLSAHCLESLCSFDGSPIHCHIM